MNDSPGESCEVEEEVEVSGEGAAEVWRQKRYRWKVALSESTSLSRRSFSVVLKDELWMGG